jgi:hypothetical protein
MAKRLIPAFILYVLALLFAAYAVWTIVYFSDAITQAIEAGQFTYEGLNYGYINIFVSNCGPFFAFAFLIAAAGIIIQRLKPAQSEKKNNFTPAHNADYDNELDEWFDDIDSGDEGEVENEVDNESEVGYEVENDEEVVANNGNGEAEE